MTDPVRRTAAGDSPRAARRVEMRRAQKARRRQEVISLWQRLPRPVMGLILAGILLSAAGILLLGALVSDPDSAPPAAGGLGDTVAGEPGPYDLSPAAPGFDLQQVVSAKFVSLSFPDGDGVRSMMLTQDRPEFQEMAAAVAGAERVSDQAPEPGEAGVTTVTFVTEGRETASLSLGEGPLFYWQGATYQAEGDLQRLVEQAGSMLD